MVEMDHLHHVVSVLQQKELLIIGDLIYQPSDKKQLPSQVQHIIAISNDNLDKLADMANNIRLAADMSVSIQVVNNISSKSQVQCLLMDIEIE
ncbi:hypothetical protein NPIL_554771 [Nephila pilipes]|uniref:Uncharacterized protein n=1 Tax=Nephila pilipes TaxID=299642 RepID=A0A8X6MZ23_NEPPI|nr:hypothetical protein NPIL_554771 [Nephila pilipes]